MINGGFLKKDRFSAYKAQLLGCAAESEMPTILKVWTLPKCKFFAWLLLQNQGSDL
jgi:hypothetical protein